MGREATRLLKEILNMMEERGLEQWEAEWIARELPKEIESNSERKRRKQPFTVCRD